MEKMMAGIYIIQNLSSGKVCIGRAKNLNLRWAIHKSFLKKGVHVNKHLQAAYDEYGIESFKFSIIEVLYTSGKMTKEKQTHLKEREQYWTAYYKEEMP